MTDSFSAALRAMFDEMKAAPAEMQPSKFWQDLNRRHAERTVSSGIANFKRTLAKDYFTWMRVLPWDPQIRFLVGHLPLADSLRAALGVLSPFKHRHIPLLEGFALNFLTRLVWQYAEQEFPEEITALSEPSIGNPPAIRIGRGIVSQDLANQSWNINRSNQSRRVRFVSLVAAWSNSVRHCFATSDRQIHHG
ncbi:hypothetical protein AJ88_38915 [Mesorhizobium amorphae CCBAU 01583]|nr:hypothetical protein AJ88_38915 [Mesorhizobium amorphae CCBAU 01583]